ncbi:MAG: hypothetical protein M9928_09235 [Anaerolineae bacterium]|nr:hypothetical protein [Anaerolineae bacterium]MCO5205203.1 hypothetical protein [Anaerolineae bacterium]
MATIPLNSAEKQSLQTTMASIRQAHWLWHPTAAFIATRVGIALIAYFAVMLLPANTNPAPYHLRGTENILIDVFGSRWDTGFYVSIAEEGYQYAADPFPSVPFFPLLPILMRAGGLLTGDVVTAGILIVNMALWAASILFYRLVQMQWDDDVANRAVWYLLIFPTAFFGSAIYTESLFLLTAIGALYAARRGHWWLAGVLGILTASTRLVGIIVAPMLFVEWWQQRQMQVLSLKTLAATFMPPLGTLAYIVYLWRAFGDPLGFMTASAAWGRVAQSPAVTIGRMVQNPDQLPLNDWIDFAFILFFFICGFILIAQRQWSEGVFVWLGVLIPFSSGLLMSQRRYMWVLFPVFILLARWGRNDWVDRLITSVFLVLLALFVVFFANMYWIA